MVRIGVLSDTHLPDTGDALIFLQELAARHFADVDLILHAGDIVAPDVLRPLLRARCMACAATWIRRLRTFRSSAYCKSPV